MGTDEAVTKRPARQRPLFKRNELVQPFLKWAGGKRQLLHEIRKYIPKKYNLYFEPFVGAGAVFFDIQPQEAVINDANQELINCYRVIKTNPEELIKLCNKHQRRSSREYFYKLRALDRTPDFDRLSNEERAARIIYLNKTGYNGLFRVNKNGQLNVPYGDRRNPQIVDDVVICAISRYLNEAQIEITDQDFEDVVGRAGKGDFVYFDPPYHPVSKTSSFTDYNLRGFEEEHQKRLKKVCDELTKRGCQVLLSNSDTTLIKDLYKDETRYTIASVKARRNINSVSTKRGAVSELLIYNNYDVEQVKE